MRRTVLLVAAILSVAASAGCAGPVSWERQARTLVVGVVSDDARSVQSVVGAPVTDEDMRNLRRYLTGSELPTSVVRVEFATHESPQGVWIEIVALELSGGEINPTRYEDFALVATEGRPPLAVVDTSGRMFGP